MKPLIVLIVTFAISLLTLKISNGRWDYFLSARMAMSVMLLFTALGHFLFTDGMILMIPNSIPFKREIVYATALIEIAGAVGLHIYSVRQLTAWLLILFLLLILPANIKAAIEQINYQKGTFDGYGLKYLWFRIPLQVVFIIWIYLSSIKPS